MWDQRYAEPGFSYTTEPNDFLRERASRFPAAGRLLSVAEGEGRNALFLAGLGHAVTAVDQSAVGLAKAARLAAERKVPLADVQEELSGLTFEPAREILREIHEGAYHNRPSWVIQILGIKPV